MPGCGQYLQARSLVLINGTHVSMELNCSGMAANSCSLVLHTNDMLSQTKPQMVVVCCVGYCCIRWASILSLVNIVCTCVNELVVWWPGFDFNRQRTSTERHKGLNRSPSHNRIGTYCVKVNEPASGWPTNIKVGCAVCFVWLAHLACVMVCVECYIFS